MEINLKNFKLSEEGRFSITRPYESRQIINNIEKFIMYKLYNYTITDATACMGGDLIKFSKCAKFVIGVEKNLENFEILQDNCKTFDCENINLIHDDYLNIYEKLSQDIIYIDPPWNGPEYKMKQCVFLKIGDIDLYELVNNIINKKLAKYVFIKAPSNVCLNNLEYTTIYTIYNKNKKPSFKLICINVNMNN